MTLTSSTGQQPIQERARRSVQRSPHGGFTHPLGPSQPIPDVGFAALENVN